MSGAASPFPLLASKAGPPDELVLVSFEDLGVEASSYSVYSGDIGTWYGHSGATCGATPGPLGGRRDIRLAVPQPAGYLLVTASNDCAEGPSGRDSFDRPHPQGSLDCLP